MAQGLQLFTSLLMVQMFYAIAVTLLVTALPTMALNQVVAYTGSNSVINFTTLANSMQGGVTNQLNIPVLDFGALLFYSSSIILNLMVNFFFAIPAMLTIFLTAMFTFFPVDYTIQIVIKGVFVTILTIFYYLSLLSFIMGSRSAMGGGVR